MELDHVFVFVDSLDAAARPLAALGLVETYRRIHPGQGTSNICYAFDNLFLELLWLSNAEDARASDIARTRLYERSRWRHDGTCPFGISWRLTEGEAAAPFPTWPYCPSYLPDGMTIPVAIESDVPEVPMIFQSPGTTAPVAWPQERRGDLQHDAGFGAVAEARLTIPDRQIPGPTLRAIAAETVLTLEPGDAWALELVVTSLSGPEVVGLPISPAML